MRVHSASVGLILIAAVFPVSAAESIRPTDVRTISVFPKQLHLRGIEDGPQLAVTAELSSGRLHDVTADVTYTVGHPQIVRVTRQGRVLPLSNGSTEVIVTLGSHRVRVPIVAESMDAPLPINFPNQIVPIFTKLTCNSGGCHGKASGQNGFKLSLLGAEPEQDYTYLLKEGRGRRLLPSAPDYSLLLTKATGKVAHGGGRKMEPDSEEYKLVRRWIAAGMPYGKPTDPVVTEIRVFPEHRILSPQSRQQMVVHAYYSDGSVEDITRRAQYESNDTEIANVDANGVVTTLSLSGQAAVMARYQGLVAVFRVTVPLSRPAPPWDFPIQTFVDQFTSKKWRELGLMPSERATDEQFVRRAYLDITGTLPTPAQVLAFVQSKDPKKHDQLIDHLLETPEYAYYFANKWADILKVKRRNQATRAFGTFSFHDWIRDAMAKDKPYDEFAREILAAIGDETKNPPTVWYKEIASAENFVDDTAQVFLGLRIACANCHHHPYEKWSQDDYWGMAAFYARVGTKTLPVPGVPQQNQQGTRQVIYTKSTGTVINKRTNKPAVMKALDADEVKVPEGTDPRHVLVDWMVDAKNPFFARAVANRYWAHFFGRGIVDPLDDMRITNPPSNPELLDALAKHLIDQRFSLKALIRAICKSRTYQLSSTPNEYNKSDKQAYARYYPKRMSAEVLFDAVCQVTDSPSNFAGLPRDRFSPNRAIMLPDESFVSYFLDVFGRPQRLSACECERVNEANLAQSLHLLNSDEVQGKLARPGGRADRLAKDPRPEREKIEELFLWTLGRKPSDKQLAEALKHLEKYPKQQKNLAYENLLWALINSKAFLFNQ